MLREREEAGGPVERTVVEKRCNRCGAWKPLRHFHRDRTRPDRCYPTCKQCRRPGQTAAQARWRAKHPELVAANTAKGREAKRVKDHERYWADPEASRASKRESARRFRARHRERLNAQKRADYHAHADWYRAEKRLRRAGGPGGGED